MRQSLLLLTEDWTAKQPDSIDWLTESQFTLGRITAKKAARCKTLDASVYLESNSPHDRLTTNRPFTSDEAYRHAVRDHQFDVSQGPEAGLQVAGILKIVSARRNNVLGQLVT